jgi:serine/threonine-protein kinase CLA4
MAAYFNTSSAYPSTPPTPSSLSTTSSLQISAPLTADIIKVGYVSIKDSWLWGKKYLVLRPVTLSMYKNERIDGGTPTVVISLNDVVNLKREETKDYCFSMEIRGGKVWLFSFKSDGELYAWMDEVYSVCIPRKDEFSLGSDVH